MFLLRSGLRFLDFRFRHWKCPNREWGKGHFHLLKYGIATTNTDLLQKIRICYDKYMEDIQGCAVGINKLWAASCALQHGWWKSIWIQRNAKKTKLEMRQKTKILWHITLYIQDWVSTAWIAKSWQNIVICKGVSGKMQWSKNQELRYLAKLIIFRIKSNITSSLTAS